MLQTIRAFQAHPGIVLGQEGRFQTAGKDLQQSSDAAAKKVEQDAIDKVEAALEELAAKANGGKTAGTSWKAGLDQNSPWETVEQEARYHLGIGSGVATSAIQELDRLCAIMDKAVDEWRQVATSLGSNPSKDLLDRVHQVGTACRITGTEAYLMDVLAERARRQARWEDPGTPCEDGQVLNR